MLKITYLVPIAAFLVIIISQPIKPKETKLLLLQQGYIDVQIIGYRLLACNWAGVYHTEFKAKDRKGRVVRGVTCSTPQAMSIKWYNED